MNTITLQHFLKENTQTKAAALLGCSQGAIHQMILNGRDIRFEFDDSGEFIRAYEVKKLGKTA